MPRRRKKRRPGKRRRKPQRRRPAARRAQKQKRVVYEFRNPAVEGSFTVELPPGWRGGRISLSNPKTPPR